jgi:hypothetical protein
VVSEVDHTFTPEYIQTALEIHEPEWLIGHLLLNDVLFLNTNWSEKDWPEEARNGVLLLVICNDCFGPCADCERIQLGQIETLYRLWQRDPIYGPIAWVIAKRKERPWAHKKIGERMTDRGWDVEALVRGELPALPKPEGIVND